MAAKNKPKRARARDDAPRQPDVREIFGMYPRASQHRDHLLEEARTLRAAGTIREARGVEKRAAQIEQLLGALEAKYRRPDDPHATE